MSTPAIKPIPDGFHSLTPHLICAGAAEAIEFYVKAFNAVEVARMPAPNGKLMNAVVRIGDSVLMLVDENPQWGLLGPKALRAHRSPSNCSSRTLMRSSRRRLRPGQRSPCLSRISSGVTATVSSKTHADTAGRWRPIRAIRVLRKFSRAWPGWEVSRHGAPLRG